MFPKDIDRQALTSAVEEFSFKHDMRQLDPALKKYRELIPGKNPAQGQQYAFEVDLDKCTGCKACVSACHHENGLDEDETWRSVGLVQGGKGQSATMQHITTACHHCLDPACMHGCPTKAYVKDPATGIVKHLDDQCFGCQYCILKCPYDVPKYNKKRGIVHKCDMCIGRLSAGEAPACVRACPTGAIRIALVDTRQVREQPQEYVNVPAAPASDYTFPTTKYKTTRTFPADMEAVDNYDIKPEASHWPLVVMLVLTQLSVGAFAAQFALRHFINPDVMTALQLFHCALALGIGLLAMGASVLHLGRPLLAPRAILGFRRSWLSREIVVFGLFAASAIVFALTGAAGNILNSIVVGFGLIGVFCSVMVYWDTKRPFWHHQRTTFKFFLSAVASGCSLVLVTFLGWAMWVDGNLWIAAKSVTESLGQITIAAVIFKLVLEASALLHLLNRQMSFMKKTALLMTRHLKRYTAWRFISGAVGGIFLPFILVSHQMSSGVMVSLAFMAFAIFLTGEFLERYLFFRAVVPLKMPGARAC